MVLSGVFGLGYMILLSNITAKQRDWKIGRVMAITTVCQFLVMVWNFLSGLKVINAGVVPALFGIFGITFLMWLDSVN